MTTNVTGTTIANQDATSGETIESTGKLTVADTSSISGGQVTGPIKETWNVAPGSLRGTIYYETYDSQIAGGLGSMAGALVGGLLIGVSEALSGFLIEPSMKSMFSFALLIAVLVLRPHGLLGRRA